MKSKPGAGGRRQKGRIFHFSFAIVSAKSEAADDPLSLKMKNEK